MMISRYYAGGSGLDELIADPSVDIHEVVREVERLCDREMHASEYYRKHPELQYSGHPWMRFVASGGAAHLGWHADLPGYREETTGPSQKTNPTRHHEHHG